jgi:hypothetical protein
VSSEEREEISQLMRTHFVRAVWIVIVAAFAFGGWITSLQANTTQNSRDIHKLEKRLEGIEEIRTDVRWIKEYLKDGR